MITIEGLNKRQRILADIIWALDTKDKVEAFIRSLPKPDQQQAITVVEMMIWAYVDQCESIDPEVTREIDRIAKR